MTDLFESFDTDLDYEEPLADFGVPVHLLTDLEKRQVAQIGLPSSLVQSLVDEQADGTLVWSLKGLQAFRAACAVHEVQPGYRVAQTWAELQDWIAQFYSESLQLKQVRLVTLANSGTLPGELQALAEAELCSYDVFDATLRRFDELGGNAVLLRPVKQ
jgi:hypothetical protein